MSEQDALRVNVAEAAGWKWWQFIERQTGAIFYSLQSPTAEWPGEPRFGGLPIERPPQEGRDLGCVPSLTLDWMHEIEAGLSERQKFLYGKILWETCPTLMWHATAEQRALAYLATMQPK